MKVREEGEDWEEAGKFETFGSLTMPDEVAERYAEYLWEFEQSNPSDFERDIEVMDDAGNIHKFKVTAEASVIFFAEETENDTGRD